MSKDKLIPELRFPEFGNEGEWEKKTLENVADSESSRLALNKIVIKENGNPVYGADSIVGYINEFQQEDKYISIVKDGSGVGRLNLCKPKSSILGTLACIKSKDLKKYNIDWIYYQMNTIDFTSYKKGSGIPHIYFSDFKKEPIGLPNPKEQQKIASCLSSLDEVIAAHSQKLELLKDHKKGLMQNLFPQEGETIPKYRFKEFENDGDWEVKSFENLFEIGNGRDYKHLDKGEIPVYGSGGYMLSVNENLYDGESVCIGRKGTIDKPMFLTGKFWTVDTLFYTHLFKNSLPKYIFYVFENINWREHNEAGGIPSLSKTNIYKIKVLVPPNDNIEEQQKIASCLSSLDAIITEQTEKIEQLKLHKKGLMQGLFPKINN